MHGCLELLGRRQPAAEDFGQQLERGLEAARRPARLLTPVGVDRHRQLLGDGDAFDVGGTPAAQLGAVAEVQVLGQRVRRPATGLLDGGPPPNPGGPREVGEVAGARPHGLLDPEVEVDHQRLQPGEQRIALVQVDPAGLDETDAGVRERARGAPQEVRRGKEVGVEDGDQLGLGGGQPSRERACLVAAADLAPEVGDAQAAPPPGGHPGGDDGDGLVVGVVENLDLQPLARPVQRRSGVDHPLGDVALVVDRQLDGDEGEARAHGIRFGRGRQPGGAQAQVDEVGAIGEEEAAGEPDQDYRGQDHRSSKSA